MAKAITTKKRAKAIALGLFLVGLAIVTFTKSWWPGVMPMVGIPLAVRQYLLGRNYDAAISLFVFLGVFVTVQFSISWEVFLPVLFVLGGIYIFFREYIESKTAPEPENEEDLNREIEEKQHEKPKK